MGAGKARRWSKAGNRRGRIGEAESESQKKKRGIKKQWVGQRSQREGQRE